MANWSDKPKQPPGPIGRRVPISTDPSRNSDWHVYLHRRPVYALATPNQQPWIIQLERDKYIHMIHPLLPRPSDIKLLPGTLPMFSATLGLHSFMNFRVKELGHVYTLNNNFWTNNVDNNNDITALEGYLMKFAVWGDDDNFVVLAAMDDGKLAIYKSGDKNWRVITPPGRRYQDVVLSNGRFYAVDDTGLMVVVDQDELTVSVVVDCWIYFPRTEEMFLVDSNGELLLVVMEEDKESDDDDDEEEEEEEEFDEDDYNKDWKFRVFSFDKMAKKWIEKTDLGDKVLLLRKGGFCKVAASASDVFGDGCHVGSRIFFIDDDKVRWDDDGWWDSNIQMFDMKEGTGSMEESIDRKVVYPMMCWPPPNWVNSAASVGPGTYHDQSDWLVKYRDYLVQQNRILTSQPDVVERTIPSMVDGLKAGQRKILFCSFKKNFVEIETVEFFCHYVGMQHSAYPRYGEQSLEDIIGMTQMYVGTNNINFLEYDGRNGQRLKDRYLHAIAKSSDTKLSPITRLLFRKEDDILLDYKVEDGKSVEPTWYLPIIPTVLVNGCEGSSFVPKFNPRDIIANVRRLLNCEEMVPMIPWYRRFYGTVEESATNEVGNTYTVTGALSLVDDKTLHITELPIGKGFKDYEKFLGSVHTKNVKDPLIEGYSGHRDGKGLTAHFLVYLPKENFDSKEDLVQKFKLTTTITTCNMHLADPEGVIKTYETPEKILEDFYLFRREYYKKRKESMLKNLEEIGALKCKSKVKSITDGSDGSIAPIKRKRGELFDTAETEEKTDMATSQDGNSPELEVQVKYWQDATIESLWEKDLCALESELDGIEKDDEILKTYVQNIIAEERSKAIEKKSASETMDIR